MNDICPYLCSFKSSSGYCNRTGGYDSCQYRKILGYDYEAKRFYVEPVDSYDEAYNPKDEVFRMRLTKQQSEKLKALAEKAGCTPSEYLRMMISEEMFKRLKNIFLYGEK